MPLFVSNKGLLFVHGCDTTISMKSDPDDFFGKLDQLADIGRTMERNGVEITGIRIERKTVSDMSDLEQWAIEFGRREARYRESESPLS